MKISNSEKFVVPTDKFAVGYSTTGYTLKYSVDGQNWTAYDEAIPANEVLVVTGMSNGLIYKLEGNSGDVFIQY